MMILEVIVTKIVSINPATNEVLATIEETTEEQVKKIVHHARDSFDKWSRLDINQRIQILTEIYTVLEANIEKLAEFISLGMGKPITQAEAEVKSTLKNIKWDLENEKKCIEPEITFESDKEIQKVFYEPKGISVVISPFNYPFSLCLAQTFQNLIV